MAIDQPPSNVTEVRIIRTKRRTYFIDRKQPGIPFEQYRPHLNIPEDMHGAMVYQTVDGPVVVLSYEVEAWG